MSKPKRTYGSYTTHNPSNVLPRTDDGAPVTPQDAATPPRPHAPSSSLMDVEEAQECFHAIVVDTDPVRRAVALSALACVVSYAVVWPEMFVPRLAAALRDLRDRTPWPETEDHR
jgi:hypothetical protein